MEERVGTRPHKIVMTNRSEAGFTGIRDVLSFDDGEIVLDTDMGLLTIKGKELHVSRLTVEKGEMDIEGTIDNMSYSSNESFRRQGESLLTRLFK